ncbi:MAG: nucleotide sugar dehydrogenase [Candidatus Woykebacteria bacterium]
MRELKKKIEERKAKIAVIGLGYVGLPVACMLAKAGYSVLGINRGQEKVDKINAGKSPIEGKEPGLEDLVKEAIGTKRLFATTEYAGLKDSDIMIVAVETPVDKADRVPKYEALRSALTSVAKNMKKGSLVIVESTIAPGTMKNVVAPLLEEESGLKVGRDIYLGNCPERVMVGKLLHNVAHYHRVVGGWDKETAALMVELYKTYIDGDLDPVDVSTAELVKTTENAYRDLEVAFANELALVAEKLGVNVYEVRRLVNKVEARNVHMPGAGVGGHCIPKDGLLQVAFLRGDKSEGSKQAINLIETVRAVNDFMPTHMIELLEAALKEAEIEPKKANVAVLGYSFLENSDDTRDTPTEYLLKKLASKVGKIVVQDPYVELYKKDLDKVLKEADAAVFMVAHDEYKRLRLEKLSKLMRTKVIIDGRNIFDKEKAKKLGFVYKGIGNV